MCTWPDSRALADRRARPGRGEAAALPALRALAALVALVALLALGTLAACSSEDSSREPGPLDAPRREEAAEPAASAPLPERPNIVLIVVDTLRADHLGAYGYERNTSPHFDAFADSGVLFEQARSQAACTFPSVNSLLTSRYPARFLGQPEGRMGIPDGIPTLAGLLSDRGYFTLAFSASPIVREKPSNLNPHGGFGAGFDEFVEGGVWADARSLNHLFAQRIDELPRPFFVYLHYIDPHGHYQPPEDHRYRFANRDADVLAAFPPEVRAGDPNPIAKRMEAGEESGLTAAGLEHLVDLYDDEIAFFDEQLAALLGLFRNRDLEGETVFVLTADHGEAFLEHGMLKHCRPPYDELVKVPLVVKLPGTPASDRPRKRNRRGAGRRVEVPVGLLDVAPTLLDILGPAEAGSEEAAARAGFEGRSLLPLLTGGEGEALPSSFVPSPAFMGQSTWRGVTDGRLKLLFEMADRRFELFDLTADPGETRDLRGERPDDFRRLRRDLFEWVKRVEGRVGSAQSLEDAREAERRLRALGYL